MTASASRLDSILDETLDEFEEADVASKISRMKIQRGGDDEEGEGDMQAAEEYEKMQKLMAELDNPEYGHVVKQTLQSLNTTQEGAESVDALFENLQAPMQTQHPLMAFPTDPLQGNVEFTDRNIAGTVHLCCLSYSTNQCSDISHRDDANAWQYARRYGRIRSQ